MSANVLEGLRKNLVLRYALLGGFIGILFVPFAILLASILAFWTVYFFLIFLLILGLLFSLMTLSGGTFAGVMIGWWINSVSPEEQNRWVRVADTFAIVAILLLICINSAMLWANLGNLQKLAEGSNEHKIDENLPTYHRLGSVKLVPQNNQKAIKVVVRSSGPREGLFKIKLSVIMTTKEGTPFRATYQAPEKIVPFSPGTYQETFLVTCNDLAKNPAWDDHSEFDKWVSQKQTGSHRFLNRRLTMDKIYAIVALDPALSAKEIHNFKRYHSNLPSGSAQMLIPLQFSSGEAIPVAMDCWPEFSRLLNRYQNQEQETY